jgi:hypothetical protein
MCICGKNIFTPESFKYIKAIGSCNHKDEEYNENYYKLSLRIALSMVMLEWQRNTEKIQDKYIDLTHYIYDKIRPSQSCPEYSPVIFKSCIDRTLEETKKWPYHEMGI